MDSASIFDLSRSEKLQLVEDLWDDLAAEPEAVPVHDWQKQELAPRKANRRWYFTCRDIVAISECVVRCELPSCSGGQDLGRL